MKIFFAKKQTNLYNRVIPKNAIICVDNDGDIILCESFPRHYNGNNPMLQVRVYHSDLLYWDECIDVWQNSITKKMWKVYNEGGCKRIKYDEYITPSKPIRKHKGSGFAYRPSCKNVGEISLSYGECCLSRTFNNLNI